jgi:hypothetical protein
VGCRRVIRAKWVKKASLAVPNAKRAVREGSVLVAKSAHWDLQEKEMTVMRRNVDNVHWAKQQRVKVLLNAMLVIRDNLETPKVIVPSARLVPIKPTEVKETVSNAHWESRTLIPKQHAVVVALVRLAKPKVIVPHARLDSTKIPKEKQSAVKPATRQKKYPTKTVPGVNCHRGVPAKWANI